jgi:predicted metal-dependent hydrolase
MNKIPINQLIRSRRRTVALVIAPDATLTVRAPLSVPLSRIEAFVQERSDWIRRKMIQVRARPCHRPLEFVDGQPVQYLGRAYSLVIDDSSGLRFDDEAFYFPRALLPQAGLEMVFWYRQEARRVIGERTAYFADLMGVTYGQVELSDAATRWGSCRWTGDLRFSWRLILAPLEVLDYVVVHELAHVTVPNHSRRFWARVREFCPDYFLHRAWLRKNSRMIEFKS